MARCSVAPIFASKHASARLDTLCEAEVNILPIIVVREYLSRKGLSVAGGHKSLRERVRAHVQQNSASKGNENAPPQSSTHDSDVPNDTNFETIIAAPLELEGFNSTTMMEYFVFRQLEAGIQADYKGINDRSLALFKAKHVYAVMQAIQRPDVFIRASCKADMKKKVVYQPLLCCEPSGKIKYGQCTCKAGKRPASCKHLGALCYLLEDYFRQELHVAPTETLQKWHQPSAIKCGPTKVKDIMISENVQFTPSCVDVPDATENELLSFVRAVGEETMFARCLYPQMKEYLSPPVRLPLKDTLVPYDATLPAWCDMQSLIFYHSNVALGFEECFALEERTRGQALVPEWKEQRKCRLTASNFGRVCLRQSDYAALASSLTESKDIGNLPAVRHGVQAEKVAKAKFLDKMGPNQIYDCGLVVNPNCPYLAASPDGVVITDGKPALLECKAMFYSKGKTVEEVALERQTSYLARGNEGLRLKTGHPYYFQVQGQMATTGVEKCFFVVVADLRKEPFIQEIAFDPIFWSNMLGKLRDFYFSYYLPMISS